MFKLTFYFLSVLVLNSFKVNSSSEDEFIVAVVEHHPLTYSNDATPDDVLTHNAVNYIKILEELVETGHELDLIVYPESTLVAGGSLEHYTIFDYTSYVEYNDTPCVLREDYPQFIISLSCAAQTYQTFLVVNMIEKLRCDQNQDHSNENCKNFGHYLYNTDVIFDREGTIVQRYRKYHLYNEYPLDVPPSPELATFSIDNQTFGIFTCFEILHQHPALDLVTNGIKNIIYPNMWFGELPFGTSLQIHQMWAHENNVRLYSAGANNPARGSGGSAIFDGANGPIIYDIIAEGGTNAYVANLSDDNFTSILDEADIDELARKLDNFTVIAEDLSQYSYTVLNDSDTNTQQAVVCASDDFCCEFILQIGSDFEEIGDDDNYYTYHLVAFSGARSVGGFTMLGADICGVIACLNSTIDSCGQRFEEYDTIKWPVTFKSLKIEATFPTLGNRIQFPNSLLSSFRPILPQQTNWTEENITDYKVKKTFELTEPQNRLLTFSIFGRNFDLDPINSGNTFKFNFLILLIGLTWNYYWF